MRFKLQTDYALRALLYMAAKREGNCTTDEIAGYFRISAAHLGRVIRRLQRHGYVKALRGRRGGVRLDRDPATITLGEVIEVLEDGAHPMDGPGDATHGGVDGAARLKAVLRRAHGLFLSYMAEVTLAQLAEEGLPAPEPAATGESGPARDESLEPVTADTGQLPIAGPSDPMGTGPSPHPDV